MASGVHDRLYEERDRLVRFCTKLTGNVDVAEDLAQMAYMEAWRLQDRLQDQARAQQWLYGIARNICLRWLRSKQRDNAHIVTMKSGENNDEIAELEELLSDDFDLEQELEQKELIYLLDRALALLPDDTRTLLIERYVEDRPISEIAGQRSITIPAATKRLQRGKDAFRHVLTTQLSEELSPYFILPRAFFWQELRLWCPYCGMAHWKAASTGSTLHFTCSRCWPDPTCAMYNSVPQGVKSYVSAMTRLLMFIDHYYRQCLAFKSVPCAGCGRSTPIVISEEDHQLCVDCPYCHTFQRETIASLTLSLPEARQFWRTQQRIRLLPERIIEIDGRAAVVASYESIADHARLDIIVAGDTYEVLHVIKNYT